jgi:dUTP pyrophosphatase
MMIAYVAQPIDLDSNSDNTKVADIVSQHLTHYGFSVFAPRRAWSVHVPADSRIQVANEAVLRKSSAMVAVFMRGSSSLGVPMEMQIAKDAGIPVIVVTDIEPADSVMLRHFGAPVFHPRYAEQAAQEAERRAYEPAGQIAKWEGDGLAPKTGKPGDAGFDLYYCDDQPMIIEPGDFGNVRSKIAVELPEGLWGLIVGRSSTFSRRLFVAPSVIDAGYRGELYACCWNIGHEPQTIEPGDRVAQIVPFPLTASGIEWVNAPLSSSERGTSGFGSTGR